MKTLGSAMLLCLIVNGVFAAEADPEIVRKLGLKEHVMDGATVYYEPCLEEKLEVFEQAYSRYRIQMSERPSRAAAPLTTLVANKAAILDDICRIVGGDDALKDNLQTTAQELIVSAPTFSMPLAGSGNVMYLVLQETTKEYLRSGGTLPNLTYDKAANAAEYHLFFGSDADNASHQEILLPVPSVAQLDVFLNIIFSKLPLAVEESPERLEFMALHELAETAMIGRLRTADPYKRWFTDGFANAVACEVIRHHYGNEAAETFIKQYDTAPYRDIQKQVELQYWMSAQFAFTNDWPIEKEQEHIYARYCFATQEARRLISAYGIECVKKILDTYETNGHKQPGALLTAIRQATGDAIHEHLMQYQRFKTTDEGLVYYQEENENAAAAQDLESGIFSMLRMLDLLGDQPFDSRCLHLRTLIAIMLRQMGHEEEATRSITDFADFMCTSKNPHNHYVGRNLVITYALTLNQPQIAAAYARKTLEEHPEDVYAMTVMMLLAGQEGNVREARQLAQTICRLEPDAGNPCHKQAQQYLTGEKEEP